MPNASRGPVGPIACAVGAALILFPSVAHAQYLDPGAGSMIVQLVIALVVGLAATAKFYWRRITNVFARRSKERPGA
jgi:hypothetical protein